MGAGFTGKVRDKETGLDYFGARYFSAAQGRFTSPDPLPWLNWQTGSDKDRQRFQNFIADPQNLNLYAYVRNNPLKYTDPTGLYYCAGTAAQCNQMAAAYQWAALAAWKSDSKLTQKQRDAIKSVLKFLGKPGDANGVVVKFGVTPPRTDGTTNTQTNAGGTFTTIKLTNAITGYSQTAAAEVLVHEGQHGVDDFPSGHNPATHAERLATERRAYRTESYVPEGLGIESEFGLWNPMWPGDKDEQYRNEAVESGAQDSTTSAETGK